VSFFLVWDLFVAIVFLYNLDFPFTTLFYVDLVLENPPYICSCFFSLKRTASLFDWLLWNWQLIFVRVFSISCLRCMLWYCLFEIHFSFLSLSSFAYVYVLELSFNLSRPNLSNIFYLKNPRRWNCFVNYCLSHESRSLKNDIFRKLSLFGVLRGGVGRRCRLWWRFFRLYWRP
jgi:hypothetical protein